MKKIKLSHENIALAMLFVAILALFYNMYRASANQVNQTGRAAGFQILLVANELQSLVDRAHYVAAKKTDHYIGWEKIAFIDDMAFFMNDTVQKQAAKLHQSWQKHSEGLQMVRVNHQLSADLLSLRKSVKQAIGRLD